MFLFSVVVMLLDFVMEIVQYLVPLNFWLSKLFTNLTVHKANIWWLCYAACSYTILSLSTAVESNISKTYACWV